MRSSFSSGTSKPCFSRAYRILFMIPGAESVSVPSRSNNITFAFMINRSFVFYRSKTSDMIPVLALCLDYFADHYIIPEIIIHLHIHPVAFLMSKERFPNG